ncbi:MAG: hypothetical protein HC906_13475 [Bacteroidales bacterium]|nr:hypothetical protein [Bacteroidales bacterium]
MGFSEDKKGNIWIATNGGGICRFDPQSRQFTKSIVNDNNHKFLTNNDVQDILYDSEDNLWIGTWAGGIDRLNKDGVKIRNYRMTTGIGSGNNNIIILYEDKAGDIWVGTAGNGLYFYDRRTDEFQPFSYNNQSVSLSNLSFVTSIFMDSESNLWVGTVYGLVLLKKQNSRYAEYRDYLNSANPLSISSNMIENIFEDHKGRIWIGTSDKGLNLFNKKDSSFIVFSKKRRFTW